MQISFIIIALITGFLLGRIKFKIPTWNKITIMRKNLSDKQWLIDTHNKILYKVREDERFYKFDCSSFFVGKLNCERNLVIHSHRVKRNERRRLFIESHLKEVNPNYYIKYIGDITEQELIAIKRNLNLNKILNV